MKQNPIQSQTPKFDANKSQTAPVLYQHPTVAEQRNTRLSIILVNAKEFSLFIALAVVCWLVVSFVLSAMFGG